MKARALGCLLLVIEANGGGARQGEGNDKGRLVSFLI